jgi:predicted GNAT family acetyltransferase
MTPEILHDAGHRRFETHVEGEHCTLDYELDGNTMTITHVNVPDAVGNRGIAAALSRAALDGARSHGWRVIARCPYVAAYVSRHPQWSDLILRP